LLGSLMIGWGLFGLAATETLRPLLRLPALFALPSMAVAAVGSLLTAKLFGELAARVMPKDESYALSRDALLGLTGKVVFPVSETAGRVHLYDQFHTLHVASARVAPGSAPIGRGTTVIVASADPDHRYLIVEPLGFATGSKSLP
jgi:membrane protein implicated in regulation of membrane protease activity